MCDAPKDDLCEPKLTPREKAASKPCLKCKVAKPTILVRHAPYCKECFIKVFYNKARSIVNKAESPVRGERPKLLVAVSGGNSSRALLHILSMYHLNRIEGRQQKYEEVAILHIDESSAFKEAQEEKAKAIISAYDFKSINIKLEDVFTTSHKKGFIELVNKNMVPGQEKDQIYGTIGHPKSESSPSMMLARLFEQIKTLTAKEAMLEAIKSYLIVNTAQQNGYSIVAFGDSATRVAVKTIGFTSQGRGFSLPFEVGTGVQLFENINIIRPMKDTLGKEVGYFNHVMDLETAMIPTFSTGTPQKSSIDRITESLIVGLDRDYPSTISTIGRTAGKLQAKDEAKESPLCLLCGMPVEAGSMRWREMMSVSSLNETKEEGNGTNEGNSSSEAVRLLLTDLLCYGCQNTAKDTNPNTALPGFVAQRLKENASQGPRDILKDQIKSFLLDDDSL